MHQNSATGSKSGGGFTITHTGTFSAGDFQITNVLSHLRGEEIFPLPGLPPATPRVDLVLTYDLVASQTYVADLDDVGKEVPAMGAFGLLSLLAGLLGIARKLYR